MDDMTAPDLESIANRLDNLKFGAEFSRDETRVVAGYLMETFFPAGAIIIHEGRRATSMAFVDQGTVTIQKEDLGAPERHIIDLSRDAVIGEIAFFDNEPRSATVVAKTDVSLLVLTRERFDALAEEQQAAGLRGGSNRANQHGRSPLPNVTAIGSMRSMPGQTVSAVCSCSHSLISRGQGWRFRSLRQ